MAFQLPFRGITVSSWNSAMAGVFIRQQVQTLGINHLQSVVKHLPAHHGLGTLVAADLMARGLSGFQCRLSFLCWKRGIKEQASVHAWGKLTRERAQQAWQAGDKGAGHKSSFWVVQSGPDGQLASHYSLEALQAGDFKRHLEGIPARLTSSCLLS